MFAFRDTRGSVDVAFTDREGGVSAAPYDSLNLAAITDDDPGARDARTSAASWRAFAGDRRRSGRPPAPGARHPGRRGRRRRPRSRSARPGVDGLPEADGLVTARPGVTLMVLAADCVPVAARRPGGPGRRRDARRAARAGRRAPRPPASSGCAASVPSDVDGVDRAARVRALLRGARGHAPRRGRRSSRRRGRRRRGAPRPSTSGPGSAPSSRPAGSPSSTPSRCTSEDDRPLLLPARRRRAPVGWPAWSGSARRPAA